MNVLIIEDEPHAAERLEKLIREVLPSSSIIGVIDTVKKSTQWFKDNPAPDIIFMDIQLADGLSFSIFEQCEVKSPVIFTTAYDEYALKAFKVNSVDYILKPVDKGDLQAALKKLKNLSSNESGTRALLDNIGQAVQMLMKKYKT